MPIRLQLTNVIAASDSAVEVQFGDQPVVRLQDSSEVLSAVEVRVSVVYKSDASWVFTEWHLEVAHVFAKKSIMVLVLTSQKQSHCLAED